MQRTVELPVTAGVQPVPHNSAAAGLWWAGTCQGRECCVVAAPSNVGKRDDRLGCADRSNTELVQQSRGHRVDQVGELFLVRGEVTCHLLDPALVVVPTKVGNGRGAVDRG